MMVNGPADRSSHGISSSVAATGTSLRTTSTVGDPGTSVSTASTETWNSTGPTFMNPVPTSLETPDDPWRYGEGESVTAVVRIDASQAPWALAILGEASVRERHPDGSFIFAVPVTTWPAFRSFVLSFLDHAELIGPAELRDDLVNWLEALADSAAP
jgi:hypothetical protein